MANEKIFWHDMRIQSHFSNYPTPRWAHAWVKAENFMYIFGGFDGKYLNEIWRFDFQNYTLRNLNWKIPDDLKRSNQTAVYYSNDRW